jgi:hypothetical protein
MDRGLFERQSSTARARPLLTICVMLAALAAANVSAGAVLRASAVNLGDFVVAKKWQLLAEQSQPVDVLVLGDSACNQGFDAALLERLLGTSSLNLCTIGLMTALGDVWMLREYLEKVGTPKTVLVIHSVSTWNRKLRPAALARIPRPGLVLQQKERPLSQSELLPYFVARYLPLYSQDESLRELLRDRDAWLRVPPIDAHGFMLEEDPNPERTAEETQAMLQGARRLARTSAHSLTALSELGALARRHRFDVVVLHAPMHDKLVRAEPFQRAIKTLNRRLRSRLHPSARVQFCPTVLGVGDRYLESSDHLAGPGSALYTEYLANWLGRARSQPAPCPGW